jgi:hypothetical protein
VLSITKKRNFSKFVICRIAKIVLSDQLFHARRRLRVGLVPYFRLIVGTAASATPAVLFEVDSGLSRHHPPYALRCPCCLP